ncbi:MAG TPA: hypothetical protein VFU15_05120 [Bacteroidia bacterium]|nr:hypothetical protein [Bacteroidia bacterium]
MKIILRFCLPGWLISGAAAGIFNAWSEYSGEGGYDSAGKVLSLFGSYMLAGIIACFPLFITWFLFHLSLILFQLRLRYKLVILAILGPLVAVLSNLAFLKYLYSVYSETENPVYLFVAGQHIREAGYLFSLYYILSLAGILVLYRKYFRKMKNLDLVWRNAAEL